MSILDNARAEALFASSIQPSERHTGAEIRAAVADAIRRLRVAGCACRVATEFGEYPETAAARMVWAIATVRVSYRRRSRRSRNVLSAPRSESTAR